jgi:N-methylhydantoinase A
VEPTVTDANLVLGRLMPSLLGGKLSLDREAAERAIEQKIAGPLGLDIATAARGILSIVDNNMVGAIRVVSVERGHDPRAFALLPFGGAGPLHGAFLARLLGTKVILVPPAPGVLSALGLLVSSLKADFSRTALQRPPDYDLTATSRVLSELTDAAADWLQRERIPESGRFIEWHASLRYLHQGFELMVPWPRNSVTAASVEALVARFHDRHEQLYGFAQRDTPVEIVTLHATAIGSLPRPALRELNKAGAVKDAVIGRQLVDLDGTKEPCSLIDRARLGAGATIRGPAVIAQLDCTMLLLPNQIAEVDRYGTLIVQAL